MKNSVIKQELTLDSKEVAKMMELPHYEVLKKLEGTSHPDGRTKQVGIIPTLNKGNILAVKYFTKDTYKDDKGEMRPCYQCTKMGCEMLANKLTGEKGILFTAKYVERFNKMEQHIKQNHPKISEYKGKLSEARLRNSKVREANVLLKIADNPILNDNYKQILLSYASAIIADKPLIPLPIAEEKTYSAGEIGQMLGVSGNRIGRLANEHNLKTEKYGKLFHDKSKYSNKEVETFRYYESIVPVLNMILQG